MLLRHRQKVCVLKRSSADSVVVSIFPEEWHLFTWLEHPLVPALEIQCSISIEGDYIRAVWFPHPALLTPETRTEFVLLANEANLELHPGGRFWCNVWTLVIMEVSS